MDNTSSNSQHTPHASMYGGLIITAGTFIMLMALGEKMSKVLVVGAVITAVGIVFAIIGSSQKKRQEKQAGLIENTDKLS